MSVTRAFELEAKALEAWGVEAQRTMVFEELGELIVALAQNRRGRVDPKKVLEEAADAVIMATAACLIVGANHENLKDAMKAKLDRLEARIKDRDHGQDLAAIAAMHEEPVAGVLVHGTQATPGGAVIVHPSGLMGCLPSCQQFVQDATATAAGVSYGHAGDCPHRLRAVRLDAGYYG